MKNWLGKGRQIGAGIYRRGIETKARFTRGRPAPLAVHRLASQTDFAALSRQMPLNGWLEKSFTESQEVFKHVGFCAVCNDWTHFVTTWDYAVIVNDVRHVNWREHLRCRHCGLNNRMRAALHLAESSDISLSKLDCYATEQTTRLFSVLQKRCRWLAGSEYLGDDVPLGSQNNAGVIHQDLTQLTFPDRSFDLILSFEVMEHVPDFIAAFQECSRVLKPGGKMLFSTPFNPLSATNLIRARLKPNGTIEHLLPPEYHGDPVRSNGCLCFTHFGWELLDQVKAAGFRSVTALLYHSDDFGYLGDHQIQFLAEK